ncbi:MAG: DNA translocase FtsK 4TM domain-containing protein, partial [bacterium]|nr:DNA translocase FtsK 4TM domain-containing protein [bacterium]
MAKKAKRRSGLTDAEHGHTTGRFAVSIVSFAFSVFLILAIFDKAGIAGEKIYGWFSSLAGIGYYILPVFFLIIGVSLVQKIEQKYPPSKVIGSVLFLVSGLGLTSTLVRNEGGVIGNMIADPLIRLVDVYSTVVFLAATLLISILVIFEPQWTVYPFISMWKSVFSRNDKDDEMEESDEDTASELDESEPNVVLPAEMTQSSVSKDATPLKGGGLIGTEEFEILSGNLGAPFRVSGAVYTPPPIDLLERDKGKPDVGDIKANANIIKRTLMNFGIHVEMDEVTVGPSVTRYSLKPAEGVKLSRIVALQNDLSLALAAHPIRIEAPIPGKSLVGIEIP